MKSFFFNATFATKNFKPAPDCFEKIFAFQLRKRVNELTRLQFFSGLSTFVMLPKAKRQYCRNFTLGQTTLTSKLSTFCKHKRRH